MVNELFFFCCACLGRLDGFAFHADSLPAVAEVQEVKETMMSGFDRRRKGSGRQRRRRGTSVRVVGVGGWIDGEDRRAREGKGKEENLHSFSRHS